MRGFFRHHAAVVHFRPRGWQGQHRAERQGLTYIGAAAFGDFPRLAVVQGGGGDELGAVDDGAATDGQQEVQLGAAHLRHGAHQGFIAGIGFDAAKLLHRALAQRSAHFGQGAGLFRAGAAVQDQHARIVRHQGGQFGDGIKTEDDTGRVMEFKIFHAVAPYY